MCNYCMQLLQFVCELDYKMRAKRIPPAPVISHWIGLDWLSYVGLSDDSVYVTKHHTKSVSLKADRTTAQSEDHDCTQ